jgi:uncharacterized protein (UPF0262 family)
VADEANHRIVHISLEGDLGARGNPEVEHERKIAVFDLIEENFFRPIRSPHGPYTLFLSVADNRLLFDIRNEEKEEMGQIMLSLTPFRRIIRDYFKVCDSYYEAIRSAPPSKIEALDMGRRALHNEASELLIQRLDGKIELDVDTARRFITLISSLYFQGGAGRDL